MAALTFPLSRAAFFDLLPIRKITLDIPEVVAHSRTRGGEIIASDNGARLWQAEITLGRTLRAEFAQVRPLLNLLRGAAGSFMMCDPTRPFPQWDPNGSKLGSAAPVISALPNAREISISGLPANYRLMRDDLIGFSYGTNPQRFALHEVVTPKNANASGALTLLEVNPPLRPGAAVGAAITLIRPVCKAMIVPGSFKPGGFDATLSEGTTFSVIQTLR